MTKEQWNELADTLDTSLEDCAATGDTHGLNDLTHRFRALMNAAGYREEAVKRRLAGDIERASECERLSEIFLTSVKR